MTDTRIIVPRVEPTNPVASNIALGAPGYGGDENTSLAFDITRDRGWSDVVTVDWSITNAALNQTHSGTATFQHSESLRTVVVLLPEVTITDIGQLTLSNPQNLDSGLTPVLVAPNSATFAVLNISDPDPPIYISLSTTSYSGDEDTIITFSVLRTGGELTDVASVDWTITNATVLPSSGTVQFDIGEGSKDVDVAAGIVVADETGTLTLSNPQNLSDGVPTPILIVPLTASFTVLNTTLSISTIPNITLAPAATHDMGQYIIDPGSVVYDSYIVNGDEAVATYDHATKLLTGVADGTISGAQLEITTAPEPVTVRIYPRDALGTLRHNSRVYAEDNTDGEIDRQHIAGHAAVMLGMFYNGPWDSINAADYPGDPSGTNGFLSRDAVYADIAARSAALGLTITFYDYGNVMESGAGGASTDKSDFLGSMIGPNGSDGWVYETEAFALSDFSETYRHWTWNDTTWNTNISDYAVGPAPDNLPYAIWYARWFKEKYLDPVVSIPVGGLYGANYYQDVLLNAPKRSGSDRDGDQVDDDADDFWNPNDPAHVAHNGGQSVELARQWRQHQADCINDLKAAIPELLVSGETPEWYQGWATTNINDAPPMMIEYVDLIHSGFLTDQTTDTGGWPRSGITNDGLEATNHNTNDGFQKAYNSYRYSIENTLAPNHIFNDWGTELEPYLDPRHPSPEGNIIETSEPTGGAMNCFRWGSVMALMNNGLISIVGQPGSNGNSSPWFDEFGLHNTATTGLSGPEWLGEAVDGPQTGPRAGGWWLREFDNGWAIANPSLDTPLVVDVATAFGGVGLAKRINGVQDPVANDGSVVNSLTLPARDGLWLEKVTTPTPAMDNWPFISAAFAIAWVDDRTTEEPSKSIIAYNNLFISQALLMTTSAARLLTRTRLDGLWAINPQLHVIYHVDYLTVGFDLSSFRRESWLEQQAWTNSSDFDEYFLRLSDPSGEFICHNNSEGDGLAFNWGCSNTVMQRVVDEQIDQWTDYGGANGCLNTGRAINWMQDTIPVFDSRYRRAGHSGTVTSVFSSTEINVPTWVGVNTQGDDAGNGYESLSLSSEFVCWQANKGSGDYANITGHKVINGSTDRLRLETSLENMSVASGSEFSVFPTTGTGYGSSQSGALSQVQWRQGIHNFATRFKNTVKTNYALDVDGYANMGSRNANFKWVGNFTTYPHEDVGKWAGFHYERIGVDLGFFHVDDDAYYVNRQDPPGGAAGGQAWNPQETIQAIYYNLDMLKPDSECATGYATLWLNAQTRNAGFEFPNQEQNYFAGINNPLDAAFARFWCCLAWTIDNCAPQIECGATHDVPIMIDEQIIYAGAPIGTRGYGTYDPLGDANGPDTGDFTWDTPDFGTYGYVKKFENCWVIINLRKPDVGSANNLVDSWIPHWQTGGQSITGNDTWTVTGVPAGKKLQRFNRTTYINPVVGSKFYNLGPTDFDVYDIFQDTTWNNGADVGATFDCGPLECAVLMLVDA